MNTQERTLPNAVVILFAITIAIGAIVAAVLLLGGNQALGDGGPDSPAECKTTDETVETDTFTAPPGEVVTGVCIKTGENAFAINGTADPKHSVLITVDGAYGINGCFIVSGLGTPTVTVTLDSQVSGCKEVSHIDVNSEVAPTPTPTPTTTPTPTPTPTPAAEASPTPTPTALAAVQEPEALAEVQEPEALPASGGTPADGSGLGILPLLLALSGLAFLGSAGTLVAAKVRRRR